MQEIRTRVHVMVPMGIDVLEVDVAEIGDGDATAAPPEASAQPREFL